jgi:hypothetical protein
MRLLWGLMVKLSRAYRMFLVLQDAGWQTSAAVAAAIQAINSNPDPDPLPIPSELAEYLEPCLNLLWAYWLGPTSPLRDQAIWIKPQDVQSLAPQVICRSPNQAKVEARFILSAREEGVSQQDLFKDVLSKNLVLSGGVNCPIEFVGDPMPVGPNGAADGTWLFVVRSKQPIDGGKAHSGPVNMVAPKLCTAVAQFLMEVRKALQVRSDRFWLPWDPLEQNLLWVGAPAMNFTVPGWLIEDPSPESVLLDIWGGEHLTVWIDSVQSVDRDLVSPRNHQRVYVDLPRDMQLRKMQPRPPFGPVYTCLWPRRYDVRIVVANRCGNVDKTSNTGVTYPVQLHYLGAEVGQTIGQGSLSAYAELRHQPAYGSHVQGSPDSVCPVTPPIVRGKPVRIRLFFEHDAPPPHYSPDSSGVVNSLPIKCTVNFSGPSSRLVGQSCEGVAFEGVVGPAGINQAKYEEIRSRWPSMLGVVAVDIDLHDYDATGTYAVSGTVDFTDAIKTECGFTTSPVPFNVSFLVSDPSTICVYWVRVKPEGKEGKPVTDDEALVLGEWLQDVIPSAILECSFGGTISISESGTSSDDILDKVESVRGGRNGIWIALIDEDLYNSCDSSVTDWGGWTNPLGGRKAWVKLDREAGAFSTAVSVAHELGHAHPLAFKHIRGWGAPPTYEGVGDYVSGSGYDAALHYWRPAMKDFYPYASCGENLFVPGGNAGWGPPDELSYYVVSPESNHDVMTYAPPIKGYELFKTEQFLQQFEECR